MPLWSVDSNNLIKPQFNLSTKSQNVVATNRGWEYFDGKKNQILVPIRNLSTNLGDNKIYKIYLEDRLNVPGNYTNALIYVEFLKAYALVANPINNAAIEVKVENSSVNFYFDQNLSSPLGGIAVFVAPNFSYTSNDYVRIEEDALNYFSDVFASAVNTENIDFTIEEIILYGTPTPPTPPSS